jgi:hypothetical protein
MMDTWTVLGGGNWTWPEALPHALLSCYTPRDPREGLWRMIWRGVALIRLETLSYGYGFDCG